MVLMYVFRLKCRHKSDRTPTFEIHTRPELCYGEGEGVGGLVEVALHSSPLLAQHYHVRLKAHLTEHLNKTIDKSSLFKETLFLTPLPFLKWGQPNCVVRGKTCRKATDRVSGDP